MERRWGSAGVRPEAGQQAAGQRAIRQRPIRQRRSAQRLLAALGDVGAWCLPLRCVVCAETGSGLCELCAAATFAAGPVSVAGYVGVNAVFSYEGVVRDVIGAVKFRGRLDAVPVLASAMVALLPEGFDVVTWVPTSAERRRRRGFDQAELLARAVGRRLDVPVQALVRRSSDQVTHELGRSERFASVRFASAPAWNSPRWSGGGGRDPRVLVVDDVVTTGASLAAVGAALRSVRGVEMWGVAIAATPAGVTPTGAGCVGPRVSEPPCPG